MTGHNIAQLVNGYDSEAKLAHLKIIYSINDTLKRRYSCFVVEGSIDT